MNCPKCGTIIESTDQNYCEGCGYKLTSEFKKEIQPIIEKEKLQPNISPHQKESVLFGNSQYYYSFKRNYWLYDKSIIFDKKNRTIGIIKRKKTFTMDRYELQEINGTISALFFDSELRDGENNLIIEMKKQIASMINPDFTIEDKLNKITYKAHVKSKDPYSHKRGFFIRITDTSTNKIASEIDVSNRRRNKTSVEVLNLKTDKRVPFFAAMSISRILL